MMPRRWVLLTVGVLLSVVAVASAVTSIIQAGQTRALTSCVARYSNGFADALDARSRATADSQRAIDQLMARVGRELGTAGPNHRAEIRQAVQDYQQKRRMAKQLRARNPLPAPPRDACDR